MLSVCSITTVLYDRSSTQLDSAITSIDLYSTITTWLHQHNYTLPSQLNSTKDSTNTTILYHHNSTQLDSINTTILYHHNSTWLYQHNYTLPSQLNSTQLNSINTTILYHHNSTRLYHHNSTLSTQLYSTIATQLDSTRLFQHNYALPWSQLNSTLPSEYSVLSRFDLTRLNSTVPIELIYSAEKAKTGYTDSQCGFCGCVALSKPSNDSFAFTSMSFRDLPLL